ncbi:MAG: dihydrodipicolinate synthase family protein [Vicinamibacterales bacterium]
MAFEGVYSLLPTAFSDAGELDQGRLRHVVDLFTTKDVHGLAAPGVAGDVARLDDRERSAALETVIATAAGSFPIVAGTTAEGTRSCIAYSRQAKDLGASAVMTSPPRMAKLTSGAAVRHYKALADAPLACPTQKGLEWISV